MKETEAQKAFDKCRRRTAIRCLFLMYAIKNRGIEGMKREIANQTLAKITPKP